MKVLNIHKRIIPHPKNEVGALLSTLATKQDGVWPIEHWPKMKMDNGLNPGSKGGHGPIRYFVKRYLSEEAVEFQFTKPETFKGTHRFELNVLNEESCEIIHVIDMETHGFGILQWSFVIRFLHDALTEDALDKIENHFTGKQKRTYWSWWVKFLRKQLKP